MSDGSAVKAAAMRRVFLTDLATRLADIERLAGRLERAEISAHEVLIVLQAQLHDIKGCGQPYGVPRATDLARFYEARLAGLQPEPRAVAEILAEAAAAFRRLLS